MTTLENAARQALEALEAVTADVKTTPTAYEALRQAIASLSQALEQPNQEPVAWMDLHEELGQLRWMGNDAGWDCAINAVKKRLEELALYTEPRQREWVGLTEEEAADCWSTSAVKTWKNIEAKLKEKNT